MLNLTALPLKTAGPEFSTTWLVIIVILIVAFLLVKYRESFSPMLKLKALKKDNAYRIERVAVLADAKLMRVDCDGKETFIYSDANGVVELRHMHDLVVKENGEESNSSGTEQVQDDV